MQRALNHEQSAPIFFNFEVVSQRAYAHPCHPHHGRSLQLSVLLIVFKRDFGFSHSHDACLCMHLDSRFVQSRFDVAAKLFAHAGHQAIGHLYYQHARLAFECAALHGIAQKVSHLGGKLYAAGASAHDGKRQRAACVLRSGIRLHLIEGFGHAPAQAIGIV